MIHFHLITVDDRNSKKVNKSLYSQQSGKMTFLNTKLRSKSKEIYGSAKLLTLKNEWTIPFHSNSIGIKTKIQFQMKFNGFLASTFNAISHQPHRHHHHSDPQYTSSTAVESSASIVICIPRYPSTLINVTWSATKGFLCAITKQKGRGGKTVQTYMLMMMMEKTIYWNVVVSAYPASSTSIQHPASCSHCSNWTLKVKQTLNKLQVSLIFDLFPRKKYLTKKKLWKNEKHKAKSNKS